MLHVDPIGGSAEDDRGLIESLCTGALGWYRTAFALQAASVSLRVPCFQLFEWIVIFVCLQMEVLCQTSIRSSKISLRKHKETNCCPTFQFLCKRRKTASKPKTTIMTPLEGENVKTIKCLVPQSLAFCPFFGDPGFFCFPTFSH